MPRKISTSMINSISGKEITTCTILKITRTDNKVFGFTEHDTQITYDGIVYNTTESYSNSSLVESSGGSVANIDLVFPLDENIFKRDEVLSGVWDHARCEIYVCNWSDITLEPFMIFRGFIGDKVIGDITVTITALSLLQMIQIPITTQYTPLCLNTFGDARCGSAVASQGYKGSVVSVSDGNTLTTELNNDSVVPGGGYQYGKLIWTSGNNTGCVSTVIKDDGSSTSVRTLTLAAPTPSGIETGDGFTAYQGCSKLYARCKVLSNVANFRGFPNVPGSQVLSEYPDPTTGKY